MRAVKLLAWVAGGLVALVAVLLAGVLLFVNPNDYKDRIAEAVKAQTGRELSLPGELKLSVFPWLALQVGEARLGNPPGFGAEPFLTLKSASLRVKLLPLLLQRKLEVDRVTMDGLQLALKRNEAGKGNWEIAEGDPSEPAAKSNSTPAELELAGVELTNSRISFGAMVADQLEVHLGRVAPGVAVPLRMAVQLKPKPDAPPVPLALQFKLTLDAKAQRYQLAELKLDATLPRPAGKAVAAGLTSPLIDIDLAKQTLAETSFESRLAGALIKGQLSGSQLLDGAALKGRFELAEVSPRALFAELGLPVPNTRDATRLTRMAATGQFSWVNDQARASGLLLKLDDTVLRGELAYRTEDSGLDFDLAVDRIDLDRYSPPPSAAPAAASAAKQAPIELPIDFLKPLKARGKFQVGEIRVARLALTELSAQLDARDGLTRLAPLSAKVYGGQYSGHISIDSRAAVPVLSLDERLAGIDMAALLKDFVNSNRLSGRGTVTAKLTATGRNSDALVRSVDGVLSADVTGGAIEGFDIWNAIYQAQSLLTQRKPAASSSQGRTAFDTLHVSATLADGVATTRDLKVASQRLQVTGEGTTNLVTQALDWRVNAAVLKTAEADAAGMADLKLANIPVKITGTMSDPTIRPDLSGLALGRVKEQIEAKKDVIKEKVKDRLKGFLSR